MSNKPPPPNTSLQLEWEKYRDQVYHTAAEGPLPHAQDKELHRAFFAGLACMFCQFTEAADLPDEEADKRVRTMQKELLFHVDGFSTILPEN